MKPKPRLARNLSLLNIISKSSPKDHKAISQSLKADTIKCLCDCCHNILQGRIRVSPSNKRKLLKHRKILRRLAGKSTAINKKKELLIKQQGGFLHLLIKPVLSAIGGLLNG